LTIDGKNLGPISAYGTLDIGAAVEKLLKEYDPDYNPTPISVTWTSGQTPVLIAEESATLQVTADRSFKNIAVTLKSPSGANIDIEPQVSGSVVEIPVTPVTEGEYTLDFVITDAKDVEWNDSLTFNVTKKPSGNGNSNNGGGGGGCSIFGIEFLVLTGAGVIILRKKKK
jgi:hypothetical protein